MVKTVSRPTWTETQGNKNLRTLVRATPNVGAELRMVRSDQTGSDQIRSADFFSQANSVACRTQNGPHQQVWLFFKGATQTQVVPKNVLANLKEVSRGSIDLLTSKPNHSPRRNNQEQRSIKFRLRRAFKRRFRHWHRPVSPSESAGLGLASGSRSTNARIMLGFIGHAKGFPAKIPPKSKIVFSTENLLRFMPHRRHWSHGRTMRGE